MKIAYLITAYSNYIHLQRLVESLNDEVKPVFFIHIDKKSSFPANLLGIDNVHFIRRRKVWWGGWSHTAAILELMKASLEFKFDYHILISGTDYPIRPNSFLHNKLEQGGEYINIIEGFQSHKPVDRVKYYYFDSFDRRNLKSTRTNIFLQLEKQLKKVKIKEGYPFAKIYHGSTWWALTGTTVSYIIDFLNKNPKFIKFFKMSWCPEESLIPTILGNSNLKTCFKNNLTFTDWSSKPAPALISETHINTFLEKEKFISPYGYYEPFFARKFDDNSSDLIKKIETLLRK